MRTTRTGYLLVVSVTKTATIPEIDYN